MRVKKIISWVFIFVNQLHLSILRVLIFVNCLFFEKKTDLFIIEISTSSDVKKVKKLTDIYLKSFGNTKKLPAKLQAIT